MKLFFLFVPEFVVTRFTMVRERGNGEGGGEGISRRRRGIDSKQRRLLGQLARALAKSRRLVG